MILALSRKATCEDHHTSWDCDSMLKTTKLQLGNYGTFAVHHKQNLERGSMSKLPLISSHEPALSQLALLPGGPTS
eukprot:2576524-Pleurochrysis_carterae.AAC.2